MEVYYGKDYKHLNEGNFPVLGTGGVMGYVDEYLYSGESILIGRKGTIDKPKYINGPFWTVDTLFYTKIKEGNPKFIFYQLNKINWLKYNEASGVPSLSANNIKNIKIKIPSLEEQKKIASFLSAIDKKIELLEKILENENLWKKEVLNRYFYLNLKNNNQKTPNDYIKTKLSDLIKISTKKNKNNEEIPVLSINNKLGFVTQEEQFENRAVASEDKSKYKIVEKGGFAYNPARVNVGSIARLKNYEQGIISPMYIIFKVEENKINSIFLEHYINSNYFKLEILKRLEGSVRLTLSADALKNIEIILPPIDEQKRMGEFFEIINKNIEKRQIEIDNMNKFKKYLLQKMFC